MNPSPEGLLPEDVPPDVAHLLRRLRLRHLSCFVAAAQEEHLGRAADRLGLSQPAVTKTLNELEALAGARLLDRGRHGARLTPAGEEFLRHAVGVTEAFGAAAGALAGAGEPAAVPVRVGALPTVASVLLPDAVARLRARHPGVGVQVRSGANRGLLEALRAAELDLVIGRMAEPATMRGLSFELLYAESLAVVVHPDHPLTRRPGPVPLAAVLEHPLVVATAGTVPRHHTEALLQRQGLRLPGGCVETLEVSVARALVRRSDAVWFTPERTPQVDLDDGVLVRLDVPARGTAEPVGLLRRSVAEPAPLADDLAAILRGLAAG
ncbi:LysR substrate-binding domain-containing protein [Georgenia thermotolerans]|uniref:LysR family transcriptional regulator n=1 Tax=Georgenia thermotolerans TaxID=527326 RepID=A0A7J5UMQ1_9MICO|nr:LysR substrate-binding domain-containing protein [Georgenia thermotolerans]KAE8763384.1 LysR family transcriptional regulator [Georgenia thermotolerans]